jgi:hypothetical protein
MSLAEIDIIAEVRGYEDVHHAMRCAAVGLEISRKAIDELAGCPDGYSGTLLADRPKKKIGWNLLGGLLPTLGLKLLIVRDHDAIEQLKHRRPKRHSDKASNAAPLGPSPWERAGELRRQQCRKAGKASMRRLSRPERRELARQGGKARAEALTDRRRSEIGRAAGLASAAARRQRAGESARSNQRAQTNSIAA